MVANVFPKRVLESVVMSSLIGSGFFVDEPL